MRTPLCTLFGFNYLDKGLALYGSLERVATDFVLYVLAMDDDCYAYLEKWHGRHLVPIRLTDFENEALLKAKAERSFGEYCWTCSSSLIRYVLDRYAEQACAYIDADMYFYADPAVLFKELENRGGSVLLTGHRFNRCERQRTLVVGRFCVEFNLFLNRREAREALDVWIGQCLEKCSSHPDDDSFGDQKYLDEWLDKYEFVRETLHPGAGVAPWNIAQYRLVSHDTASGCCVLKWRTEVAELVFYHFEGISYRDRHHAKLNLYRYWGIDDRLVRALYTNYLKVIEQFKQQIQERTGREVLLRSHPAFQPSRQGFGGHLHSILRKLLSAQGRRNLFGIEIPRRLFASKDQISF